MTDLFDKWFDEAIPNDRIACELSHYETARMAFFAGAVASNKASKSAVEGLEQVILRMQLRVDSGKENVAIGQNFAGEIVAACATAVAVLKGNGLAAPAVRPEGEPVP